MDLFTLLKLEEIKYRLKHSMKVLIKRPVHTEVSISKLLKKATDGYAKTFLQVGSNDGKKNDPLYHLIVEKKLEGIFVEPLESNFKKLVENYSACQQKLIFEQVGISNESGLLEFYHVTDIKDDEPNWYDQVGSFDKETFIKNIEVVPELLNRIGKREIDCYTISDILEKNKYTAIDLIHIDAEGFDYRLIKGLDYDRWKPKIILFETDWMTQYELKEAIALLKSKGYKTYFSGIDCIALK